VADKTREEERIIRLWTPVLLRTILTVSMTILVAGLFVMAARSPSSYVERFQSIQSGSRVYERESWGELFRNAVGGDPHAVVTVGLIMLTLVPLGRVAFCLVLFAIERDVIFVVFTAYVLAGLVIGAILGGIG
jgi:uncharacterized membrane protein